MNIPLHYNFNQLSLKDLLDGRDEFHNHLMNKRNVVATAVGRYLVRTSDIDEHGNLVRLPGNKSSEAERRITESIVTSFSWPCVLVFVRTWETSGELASEADMVPKFLYCKSGTIIPTCVVLAPEGQPSKQDINESQLNFPSNKLGCGFPVKILSQQEEHIATAGCLVTDGHSYYMLTNRHVAGPEGQAVTSRLGGESVDIGYTGGESLGKVPFTKLYPGCAEPT